jgi:hypothetical protein
MRKLARVLPFVGTVIGLMFIYAAPAQAQATRTWVSGVGDDVNPCSRTAPCKTFAGAISKTAVNGEINCLDPAGYGAVTITKSITLDCRFTHGGILNAGVTGVLIPFDNFTAVGEVRKTVRLRGLSIEGADTGTSGVRITGAAASAGSEVFVEDTIIDGNFGGIGRGISDERTGGGELFVTNTTVRNVANTGILINPGVGSVAGSRIDVVLDNVRVFNANYGVAAGNSVRLMINNSVLSGNTAGGLEVEGPLAASEANFSNSVSSGNGNGIERGPGTATIRLNNSDISFNTQGISGATFSHGNNRITGNGSPGTAPTLIAPAFQ